MTLAQRVLQLERPVEMILDDAFISSRDEDEMLGTPLSRLIHDVLDRGPVNNGEHFLRHCLCRRKEARAKTGDGKDGFTDLSCHVIRFTQKI
jgi:hypothetical protein